MTLYRPPDGGPDRAAAARSLRVDLLQGYDEMIMSYGESRGAIIPDGAALPVLNWDNYLHAVMIDGILAGHWRHQLAANDAVVQVQPIRPWSAAERARGRGRRRRLRPVPGSTYDAGVSAVGSTAGSSRVTRAAIR